MGGARPGPGARARKRLGIKTFETYSQGDNLMYRSGKLTRWSGDIPPVSPAALAELEPIISKLNSMAAQVPDQPWKAAKADQWDSETVETFVEANAHTADARWLTQLIIESVYGAEAADVSLLDLLSTIRSVGGNVFTLVGSAQSTRFVGGTQQLSQRLAAELGGRVRAGRPGAGDPPPSQWDAGRREHVWTSGRASRALVAVPPPLVDRIEFQPPLLPSHSQLAQRQPMGTAIKCNALYQRPFWRPRGLNGYVISDTGPVKIAFDNSPPDGSPGVLVGFFEGSAGSDFYDRSRQARRTAALQSFARYFGAAALHPTSYLELVWAAEPYTRGAYGSYNPPAS